MIAAALLLLSAGVSKLRLHRGSRGAAPDTASAFSGGRHALEASPWWATAELIAGLVVLLSPPPFGAALAAFLFLTFAAVHAGDLRAGDPPCACFGARGAASPARGMTLCGGFAGLCGLSAWLGYPGLPTLSRAGGLDMVAVVAVAGLLSAVWRWAFSAQPGTAGPSRSSAGPRARDLVDLSARWVERHSSRRDFLLRLAVVGSALAVAPLRYLLYPGPALAILAPPDCPGGLCANGYTGFCCEITPGHVNTCPEDTFPGGWWMCTDYSGRQLCADAGVRYYVDCNALLGRPFPGGCHCGDDNCDQYRINCNIFRYGQCNTEVPGVTAVVCRMVVCENPATIDGLHCSAALAVDDATCDQEAPCLEPPAVAVTGAGGV